MLSSKERTLVYDSEANGLLNHPELRMWCVVAQDYHTEEMFLFHDFPKYNNCKFTEEDGSEHILPARDGTLKDGVKFISQAKSIICHNQIGYDQFLMKKFYPQFRMRTKYPEVRDTLLESQVYFYDRRPVKGYRGLHGLEVWGARVNIVKPAIKDWSFMDAMKLHRCLEDVKINTKVARALEEERDNLWEKNRLNFDQAVQTEQHYRYWCTIQELNGALVDAPHMERCIVELDGLMVELRDMLEPQLPPSVKAKGVKTTTNEVQGLLGIPKAKRKLIEYTRKEVNGELKRFTINELYKPTTKWTKTMKGRLYGVTIDGAVIREPEFDKLKEARDYAKSLDFGPKAKLTYPSTDTSCVVWNANTRGYFDDGLTQILGPHTKVELTPSTMSQHEKVKLMLVGLGWQTAEWTFKKDSKGQFERAKQGGTIYWPKFKVNGNQLSESYKPGDRIPNTPKLTDDSYATLPDGLGQAVGEYNTYSHRRKFIKNPHAGDKGLLNNIRPDGRISCGLMTFGTSAGRAAQYGWVNAPSVQALYGENIRRIIKASPGCTLVGIDMPSAHPRILADPYCTGNDKFIDAVCSGVEFDSDDRYVGTDFHTVNAVLFNLISQEDVDRAVKSQDNKDILVCSAARKIGKGGSYCTLYGGSDKKLALTLGIPVETGAKIKKAFLDGLGLSELLDDVQQSWDKHKRQNGSYISVLGGYHIWSNSKHKIINYKALGSEAVIQKHAVIWICRQIRDKGLKVKLICNVHDELLFDVPDSELEEFKPLASEMYHEAAKGLGLVLDWHSHAMVGQTYADCH